MIEQATALSPESAGVQVPALSFMRCVTPGKSQGLSELQYPHPSMKMSCKAENCGEPQENTLHVPIRPGLRRAPSSAKEGEHRGLSHSSSTGPQLRLLGQPSLLFSLPLWLCILCLDLGPLPRPPFCVCVWGGQGGLTHSWQVLYH